MGCFIHSINFSKSTLFEKPYFDLNLVRMLTFEAFYGIIFLKKQENFGILE